MQQSIIPSVTEKYPIWKRTCIFLLDTLMSLGIFLALFFTLGIFSSKSICVSQIATMNNSILEVMDAKDLAYTSDAKLGIYKIDYDSFIDSEVLKGTDIEKANEKFYDVQAEVDQMLNKNDNYVNAYKNFFTVYTVSVVTSMAIPLLIFQMLIPMLTKKRQTLGMMIFKVGLVDSKSGTSITNVKVFLRFLFMFTCEYLCVFLLINWIGIFFVGLVSFAVICFTNNRQVLHDLVIKAKVTPLDQIYSE